MIKKTENWKTDAFGLWCWRNLLRVPWTARRSIQSILKKINPEYSLERLMLKLKLKYFGYLVKKKSCLIGKGSDAGKDWRQEEKGTTEDEMVEWHHLLNGLEFEQTLGGSEGQGSLGVLQSMGSQSQIKLTHWAATKVELHVVLFTAVQ